METAYAPGTTFIDDADFLRLTGWPEIQGAVPNRRLMRHLACFACEASRSPAVTATLHNHRTIALCQSCLLVPGHVTTFVGAFLADRRAAALATGYAAHTALPPGHAASCERVQR